MAITDDKIKITEKYKNLVLLKIGMELTLEDLKSQVEVDGKLPQPKSEWHYSRIDKQFFMRVRI